MATLTDPTSSAAQALEGSNQPPNRPARSLERALKLAGGVGALCYAAGYIIASIHSQQWSIGSLTLLDARYVGSGLCFFLLLALTFVYAYYSGHYFFGQSGESFPRSTLLKKIGAALLYCPLPVVLSLVVITVLSTGPMWGPGTFAIAKQAWTSIWSDAFNFLVGWHLLLLTAGLALFALVNCKPAFKIYSVPSGFWLGGVVIILLICAMKNYAYVIYPLINPAFGGGEILDVKLLINESKIAQAGRLLPMEKDAATGNAPWSKTVGLMDQNEKLFYLLVPNDQGQYDHGIQLSKDLVDGVVAVQPPVSQVIATSK